MVIPVLILLCLVCASQKGFNTFISSLQGKSFLFLTCVPMLAADISVRYFGGYRIFLIASFIPWIIFGILNYRQFWLWVLLLGGTSNVLVVFANGGRMPVSSSSANILTPYFQETAEYCTLGAHTKLPLLADVIPTGVSVCSIGDILLLVGFVFLICRVWKTGQGST